MQNEKNTPSKSSPLASLFGSLAGGGKPKFLFLLFLCGAVGILLLLLNGSAQSKTPKGEEEGGVSSPSDEELAQLLSQIEGVGEVRLYLTRQGETLRGIAVLCRGGEDPQVQKKVIDLLCALYDLGSHRIYVGGLKTDGIFGGP